jgi:hypothetical protein
MLNIRENLQTKRGRGENRAPMYSPYWRNVRIQKSYLLKGLKALVQQPEFHESSSALLTNNQQNTDYIYALYYTFGQSSWFMDNR